MKRATTSGLAATNDENPDLPSLRFYHSVPLRAKSIEVIEALETSDDPTTHREALAAVVIELTEVGLEYYFVRPVKAAKVGFMAEQSTKLGISSILKVMGPVTRRIIGGMDSGQLQVIAAHMRHLMQ